MKHPLWQVQWEIEAQYNKYLNDCTKYVGKTPMTPGDVFHFLFMKGFIQGKRFLDFVDTLPELSLKQQAEMMHYFPLREGHIPMDTRIGRDE